MFRRSRPVKTTEGSAVEFSNVQRGCVYGSDVDTNVKVAELIARELSGGLPGVITQRPCGDNEMHVNIQSRSAVVTMISLFSC